MSETLKTRLVAIDALIPEAQGEKAREEILALCSKPIPLGQEVEVAQLARRCHLPELGAQLLHPIVRVSVRVKRKATDADFVEYAACLLRMGASSEARTLLRSIKAPEANPDAWFFEAGALMQLWDYSAAIPVLRKYITQSGPTAYQQLVARINLSICLSFEQKTGEARSLLLEAIDACTEKKLTLLNGICLRLMGNLEVDRNEWEVAKDFFEQAKRLLSKSPGLDDYLARKWIAIAHLSSHPDDPNLMEKIFKVREEAQELRHWESLRDIDFHLARIQKDEELLRKVFFGTPYSKIRKRVLSIWNPTSIPPFYDWERGEGKGAREVIEIGNGQETETGGFLKVGQSVHRLYLTLCSDFYRSFPLAELFEKVFPGDFYSPNVSELRVRQAIARLRKWFKQNKVPLLIKETKGEYFLTAEKPCVVRMVFNSEVKAGPDSRVALIEEKLGPFFSTTDVSEFFKLSRRSANDIIQAGIEAGRFRRTGSGNKIRYECVLGCDAAPQKKAS